MAERDPLTLLRTVIETHKDYIDAFLQEDVSIICINRETKSKKQMSFKLMYHNNDKFWIHNETWEYFISNEDVQKMKDKISSDDWKPQPRDEKPAAAETKNTASGFGDEYEAIAAMSEPDRVQLIQKDKARLDDLFAQKPRQQQLVTEALVETTRDAVLHNHAALMDALHLTDAESKKHTQELVDSTFDLVKSSTQLVSSNIFNDELMNTLVEKSNGTIIQHMIRVHLNGLAFLAFYNNLVSSSSAINKLRINFEKNYRPFYERLLPDTDPPKITLEKVFLGGMRAIDESDFYNWAVGFLVHDIGKAAAVEYHEGDAAFNRDIVVEHVKVGYRSVMNKTNYPREAGLITGYHHEYYGDPDGYGYFRSYIDQYKKANPNSRVEYCIAFEIEPMIDCKALAFFPAKILEIIDVFDSVTDPNRKYRKAMTTEEALNMMNESFIKSHPKLDIILFDIFSKFAREKQAN